MKPILKHTVALAALLTLSFSAAAHRVNLFAWSEGNAVQVESKFSDSTPVKGGKLTVTDTATGKVLATGKTADNGTWRFTLPAGYHSEKGVTVAIAAGEGHAATWEMTPSDLPKTVTAAPTPKPAPAAKPAVKQELKTEPKAAPAKVPAKTEAKAPVKAGGQTDPSAGRKRDGPGGTRTHKGRNHADRPVRGGREGRAAASEDR